MKMKEDLIPAEALNALAVHINEGNVKQGFWEEREICRKAGVEHLFKSSRFDLMHSELSEATEAVRKDLMSDHLPHRKGEEEELADVIIRVLDYCGAYGIPIGEVVKEKLEYNKSRPFKHGKKY